MNNDNPFKGYASGAEAWRDYAISYGMDEAINITGSYLEMNLRHEHSEEEREFCRELFAAMYFATRNKIDPVKLVYPYGFKEAARLIESQYYHASRKLNIECARGIDLLINESQYKRNFYNLELAAMRAILEYGFSRLCLVLAFNYQSSHSDGRLSLTNRNWAAKFHVPENSFKKTWLQAHRTLIDSFCNYVRRFYEHFEAEYFALPGQEEYGEIIKGYEVKWAITTSDNSESLLTGYAIAHNPKAVNPWVCWQFAVREGARHYNWGIYGNDEQFAVDAYNARVYVALNRKLILQDEGSIKDE
jgi:hypothetical protein